MIRDDAERHPEASRLEVATMAEYTVLYEKGETNWGAVVPDLPGCVSLGESLEAVQLNVREAIAVYIEVLQEQGQPIPPARHVAESVTISL